MRRDPGFRKGPCAARHFANGNPAKCGLVGNVLSALDADHHGRVASQREANGNAAALARFREVDRGCQRGERTAQQARLLAARADSQLFLKPHGQHVRQVERERDTAGAADIGAEGLMLLVQLTFAHGDNGAPQAAVDALDI